MSDVVAGSLLVALALAHSVLGELLLIRPLVANRSWKVKIGRREANAILRWTWHAAAVAWLGLAAAQFGADPGIALGAVAIVAGVSMMVWVRGHAAWPFFLLGGLYGLDSADVLPRGVLFGIVAVGVAVAAGGAMLHLLWAFGSDTLKAHTFPEDPETLKPLSEPGWFACLIAAGAAGTLAALLVDVAWFSPPVLLWWATTAALLVASIRVIGDFEHIGFFKSLTTTPFARADTRLYTPLFVSLAAAAGAALTLAGLP
ncbi:MAG: DUF3995 domain-containing protein [Actinobacteria bacterium]|nr:DUF3995 domain-containing protein [Actinomycetota bacterium]